MKLVSKHIKPLERQCKEGLMIGEYDQGKIINRRGEWGENLPPDFGVLEDTIYKVKRKNSSTQQRSDKAKRVRLEVCENVCETDMTGASALPTNSMSNTHSATQRTDFSTVKHNSSKYEARIQEHISDLNTPNGTHNSCDKVTLANGKHGLISRYFSNEVRHSGVNLRSKKCGQNP